MPYPPHIGPLYSLATPGRIRIYPHPKTPTRPRKIAVTACPQNAPRGSTESPIDKNFTIPPQNLICKYQKKNTQNRQKSICAYQKFLAFSIFLPTLCAKIPAPFTNLPILRAIRYIIYMLYMRHLYALYYLLQVIFT